MGSHLPADIFARYCRLKGYETLLVGGADENGTPTEVAALELKVTARRLTDVFYGVHKMIYDWFEISYDNFSRTSLPVHHRTTQDFFLKIYEKGYITEGVMRLPYCETDKLFLADRYVVGKCPVCGYEFARGDQCENCATLLEPEQLIDPKCKIDGSTPVFKDSDNLFLELEKLQPSLECVDNQPDPLEEAGQLPRPGLDQGRPEAAEHHPRPEVGRPRPPEGLRGQDLLRLVRRPDRVHLLDQGVGGEVGAPEQVGGLLA